MIKPRDPRELAIDLLPRSICSVQVAAVVTDVSGNIISWGWNNVGSGCGLHAEVHAISRANKARLWFGSVYVASQRRCNVKTINSKPCEDCQKVINKWMMDAYFRGPDGNWRRIKFL